MRPLRPSEIAINFARLPVEAWRQARAMRRSPDEQRAWALRRARHLVAHAYARSPFYHDLYRAHGFHPHDLRADEDVLRMVPRTSKDELLAAGNRVVDTRAPKARLIESVSSGSSGRTLRLHHDASRLAHHGLATRRMWAPFARYHPWHLQAYVYTSPYPLGSVLGAYPLAYIPTLTPPAQIVRRLRKARPHFLAAYPSHLREILAIATPEDVAAIAERLLLVSTNSEHSSRAERASFAKALGVPVADEYSTEELGRVAAECPEGRYHVFTDLVLLEDDGGRLVGTNLHEWTNPIIRYDQGDLGQVDAGARCPCGSPFPELRGLEGRSNDAFHLADGRILTPGFLLDAAYAVVLAGVPIEGYQFVHDGGDRLTFHYLAKTDLDEPIREILQAAIATRGGADLRVVRAPELPFARRGAKWRPIVAAEAVA